MVAFCVSVYKIAPCSVWYISVARRTFFRCRGTKFQFANPSTYPHTLAIFSPVDQHVDSLPLNLVCIGASAGGLEALSRFFESLTPRQDTTYVVIQHLAPNHKSLMAELLGKTTSMAVAEVKDGDSLRAEHVFLIPPGFNLTLAGPRFHIERQLREETTQNLPIDLFMASGAREFGANMVAVVLSGTGSDGTRGARVVRECGGMVIAQHEQEAEFQGMPKSIIANGLADAILVAKEIGPAINSYLDTQRRLVPDLRVSAATPAPQQLALTRIFSLLRKDFNVDFSEYKLPTINRRLQRRLSICKLDSLQAYVGLLETSAEERATLYKELLIGVTHFFRDGEVFRQFGEEYLRDYMERCPSEDLRFWVAGCSTGEEAYSLAMLFLELKERTGFEQSLKIFATDIDQTALSFAGLGTYPESIINDVPSNYLSRYFVREESAFSVCRAVREMVVFARHDVTQDPPFTRIDVISCRNLLIYLSNEAQRRVTQAFNFSLKENGLLLLGSSETLGESAALFETLNSEARIFKNLEVAKARLRLNKNASGRGDTYNVAEHKLTGETSRKEDIQHLEALLNGMMGNGVSFAALISRSNEVLRVAGDSNLIMRPVTGKFSNNISSLLLPDLVMPISTGVAKAYRERQDTVFTSLHFERMDGSTHRATIIIKHLLLNERTKSSIAAVYVRDADTDLNLTHDAKLSVDELAQQRIDDLENELTFTRENLRSTIENLESANEELQATNEELLASNEELQSTNEELQSVNEELHTVATEHERQMHTITRWRLDMDNFLRAARAAYVLLDENLLVRNFSPNAARIFNVIVGDIGRPIGHISSQITDFDPAEEAATAMKTKMRVVKTLPQTEKRSAHSIEFMPYLDEEGNADGVIIYISEESDE